MCHVPIRKVRSKRAHLLEESRDMWLLTPLLLCCDNLDFLDFDVSLSSFLHPREVQRQSQLIHPRQKEVVFLRQASRLLTYFDILTDQL